MVLRAEREPTASAFRHVNVHDDITGILALFSRHDGTELTDRNVLITILSERVQRERIIYTDRTDMVRPIKSFEEPPSRFGRSTAERASGHVVPAATAGEGGFGGFHEFPLHSQSHPPSLSQAPSVSP